MHASPAEANAPAPMQRRRLAMDNQQDLQGWMASINVKLPIKSAYMQPLNELIMLPTKAYASLLDQFDMEIRLLSSPCTRSMLVRWHR